MKNEYLELESIKSLLELRKKILDKDKISDYNIVEILENFFNETLIFISFYGLDEIRIHINFFINFIFNNFKSELLKCKQYLIMQFINLLDYYPHLQKLKLNEEKMDFTDYINIELRKVDNMTLTTKQIELYRDILQKNQIIYSAPTSYGKTTICLNGFIDLLKIEKINTLLIIVPTKALINEYKKNVNRLIRENGLHIDVIESAYNEFSKNKKIYIFTQERVLAFFTDNTRIADVDYILVDEAQAITYIKNNRTPLLLKALSLFDHCPKIYLTPFVKNFNENVMKKIDNNNKFKECIVTGKESLVSNNKFIIDLYNHDKIIIYDVTFNKQDIYLSMSRQWEKGSDDCDDFLNVLPFMEKITGNDEKTIVFTTSKDKSMDWPKQLLKVCRPITLSKRMKALIKHLEQNIHKYFELINFLKHGIAFHNGYLDNYTKRQIEYIFVEEKESIKYLFCTSTISQGVNFSAKNIFAFIGTFKSDNPQLDFINLLGRAARLKYNELGNLFLVKNTKTTKYESIFLNSNDNLNIDLSNIIWKDIVKDKNVELRSYILDSNIDNNYKQQIISDNYDEIIKLGVDMKPIDSMNYSIDQANICDIENKISSLDSDRLKKYIKFYQSYEQTKEFVEFLKETYNWEKIYSKAQQKNKRILNVEFISTIITKLIQGNTINSIINYNISYNKYNNLYINIEKKTVSNKGLYGYELFDIKNIDHINIVIINSLYDVQNIIEFDVKKYIQDFYYRVNKVNEIKFEDENIENFIDFSTIDKRKIKLINLGIIDSFAINELCKKSAYDNILSADIIDIHVLFEKVNEIEGDESPLYYCIKDII